MEKTVCSFCTTTSIKDPHRIYYKSTINSAYICHVCARSFLTSVSTFRDNQVINLRNELQKAMHVNERTETSKN